MWTHVGTIAPSRSFRSHTPALAERTKNVLSGRWHSETIDLHRSHEAFMAETTKLSVEKALNKLREADTPKSKTTRMNEEIEALDEEASRLREQRLRLERHQRRSTKED